MEPKEVIIQLNNEERLINSSPDKSIMQSALEAGVKLMHSCLSGPCASCRTYLGGGEVEMKNNFSLFEAELNPGQILLCQS